MYDYHVHSTISFDGHATIAEHARAALEKGLDEICMTEHQEIDYPIDSEAAQALDVERYTREMERARAQAPGLTIKFGMETGLVDTSLGKIAADVRSAPFDFIIASQHVARGKDPFEGDFFDEMTLEEGRFAYLEELYENIRRFDEFDVAGHIGYLDKYLDDYGFKDERPLVYDDFPELIDGILTSLVGRGKGIEVNTSNYYIHGCPMPHPSIIRRFAQLGGEVATTGSDAHFAQAVGGYIPEAQALMRECGLKYVCTFTQRKPEFHKL